jgi:hypothetical protein
VETGRGNVGRCAEVKEGLIWTSRPFGKIDPGMEYALTRLWLGTVLNIILDCDGMGWMTCDVTTYDGARDIPNRRWGGYGGLGLGLGIALNTTIPPLLNIASECYFECEF